MNQGSANRRRSMIVVLTLSLAIALIGLLPPGNLYCFSNGADGPATAEFYHTCFETISFFAVTAVVFGLVGITVELSDKPILYLFAIPGLITFSLFWLPQDTRWTAEFGWFLVQPLLIGALVYRFRQHLGSYASAAILVWYPFIIACLTMDLSGIG